MEKLKTNLQLKVIVPVAGLVAMLSVAVVCSEHRIEYSKLHDQHLSDVRKAEWLMTEKINDDATTYSAMSDQICDNTVLQQAFLNGDRRALLAATEPL
ncbi:MAG: hypothetical protein DRP56_06770, partial [Planctomycetota bacterium]